MSHHFFIDPSGVLKVIQEMPVKSKTIYDKAIQKAKDNAVEVLNQKDVYHYLFPDIQTATKLKYNETACNGNFHIG